MKCLALFLAINTIAPGQVSITPDSQSPKNYKVECSTVRASDACESFNELVAKNDKSILDSLESGHVAYVCFRTDADLFIIISYSIPYDFQFHKLPDTPRVVRASGDIFYERYENGVAGDFQTANGEWRKAPASPDLGLNFIQPIGNPRASVSEAELEFDHTFDNQMKTKSQYSIQIRRSTLRFVEKLSATDPAKKTPVNATYTGYCAEFK